MPGISDQSRELRKIWSAFQTARVLITANNLRVFDYLKKPGTAGAVARAAKADRRAMEILLDALAGLGLIRKNRGTYLNTAMAGRFLVTGTPLYQGDIIRHAHVLWENWSGLDRVVKKGTPSHRSRDHGSFIRGMDNLAVLKAPEVVRLMGLRGVKKALDLGGGPGTYAREMAKRGVAVTLFDTPETIKIARTYGRGDPSRKNMTFLGGDFIHDDIGRGYDLIFLSQVLHSYSEKENLAILRKCRKALTSQGRVAVQEFLINEQRTLPVWSSLFSVNMLVNTEGGRTYTPAELRNWFRKTGFRNIRKKMFTDGVLVSAAK